MAADEARMMGERADDAGLSSDPGLGLEQAESNLVAGLGATVVGRYHQRPDGSWLNTDTGEITETVPGD